MGAGRKTLDPYPFSTAYSSRGLHGRPSSAACFCSPGAYAETSSERGLLGAVASGDQRGYASCTILHRDDVLFQLPPAVPGRNLRGPMAMILLVSGLGERGLKRSSERVPQVFYAHGDSSHMTVRRFFVTVVVVLAIPVARVLHLIIRDQIHGRSGLRWIWIFNLAPAGDEGATSTTHTCGQERKAITSIVDTTLHRCDARRPHLISVWRLSQAFIVRADAVSRPVGPLRKWRLMNATCPAQLRRIDGKGHEASVACMPDWERVQHTVAAC